MAIVNKILFAFALLFTSQDGWGSTDFKTYICKNYDTGKVDYFSGSYGKDCNYDDRQAAEKKAKSQCWGACNIFCECDVLGPLKEEAISKSIGLLSSILSCTFPENDTHGKWLISNRSRLIAFLNDNDQNLQLSHHLTQLPDAIFEILSQTIREVGKFDLKNTVDLTTLLMGSDIDRTCVIEDLDVFNPEICSGPLFSTADAEKIIPAGVNSIEVGVFKGFARRRFCTGSTCGNWQTDGFSRAFGGGSEDYLTIPIIPTADPRYFVKRLDTTPYFILELNQNYGSYSNMTLAYGTPGNDMTPFNYLDSFFVASGAVGTRVEVSVEFGTARQSCAWFKKVLKTKPENGKHLESEVVFYGTY